MASTYYDDVDFESFSFDQDPLSPVWTHSDYDNQMSGMDTFWQNMGLPAEQQHQSQVQPHAHNPQLLHQHAPQHHIQQHHTHQQQFNVQSQDNDAMIGDNFSNHHHHQPQPQPHIHQPHVHNGWSNTTNMMYIKQEVKQELEQQHQQHNTQPQQYNYYSSSSSSQNSYDSSFSASTDSDAEFEDSQQSTSWEQPQHLQQAQHQHYSYPSDHSVNSHIHPELLYIKPETKHENNTINTYNAYSSDSQGSEDNSWAGEEITFMADDENDPVDFKLPASKTPIMEAMVVCAINNWGISVIKSTPGEVIFKVLDFDRYYRISRSICSKHRPTEDIGSRVKSLRRWFTNFPKKKDRQENPQFFLSVKPNTCKKVHGLIERNTKLLNAQRKAR